MQLSGNICKAPNCLYSYVMVNETPLGFCATVWTNQTTGKEFLLAWDHMIWFGDTLPNSLLGYNKIWTNTY